MKNKNILMVGLGISGMATIKALSRLGANIIAYDGKEKDQMTSQIEALKDIHVRYYFNDYDFKEEIDLCIKSPGIPMDSEIMKNILSREIEIVSDLEAAYRIAQARFIAITGTNGKTTTTTLVGNLLENACLQHAVTGNIGYGVFYDAYEAKKEDFLVTECSSFQLENTKEFKPYISIITNLSPDHIDWHKSCENYYDAKMNIAKNQNELDYCIINYEDEELRGRSRNLSTKLLFFSSERVLDEGIFVENDNICFSYNGFKEIVMNVEDIFIPGKHNLENCLCAIAAAKILKIDNSVIASAISNFKGVEHRLEFVDEYNDVKYYNDSKGTNPDASIKAVEGMTAPLILLVGGYDKNSDFTDFIKSFNGKVKTMIIMGETKHKILKTAEEVGFHNNILVENMDEAVRTAVSMSVPGDTILLSPACASWDMYKNYGIRGMDFKERVAYYGKESRKD